MQACSPRGWRCLFRLGLGPRLRGNERRALMAYAQANGISLYYERAGSGPPLLFISGTGGDLRTKPNVFDGPLAKAFDLLAYDQRGLGCSEKPDVAYSMADYADDAAALMGDL